MRRFLRLGAPFLFMLSACPSFAQSSPDALLAQSPEQLAQLRADPHVAKAMQFLQISDTGADVLTKTDTVIDKVMLAEQHEFPGQNATFWRNFRVMVRGEIKTEADNFMLLSAQLYAQRFTDAELDQLIAFYSSGIGAKYFKERQALDSQELTLANAWSDQIVPEVLEKVRARMNAGKDRKP
ncbi:MAG TPA: DUF2059 domain-containing protein [Rhizomicrobium sp.]|nr:DUF2059 domain-containing protein [Rhizomicrobium sp.]